MPTPKQLICLCSGTSELLNGWLLVSHLLCLSVAAFYSYELSCLLTPCIALSLRWYRTNRVHLIKAIRFSDGEWRLMLSGQSEQTVALYQWWLFGMYWVQLKFVDAQGNWITICLLPDNSDPEGRRQLRLWLRMSTDL